MCCGDAQLEARARMEAAEVVLREHGLYRIVDDETSTAMWTEAKAAFDRAMADYERLCQGCCRSREA